MFRLPIVLIDLIYDEFFNARSILQTEVLPQMMEKLLVMEVYWEWDYYYDRSDAEFGPCLTCISHGMESCDSHDREEHSAPIRLDWYPELRPDAYPWEEYDPWIFLGREFDGEFYRPLTYSVFEH